MAELHTVKLSVVTVCFNSAETLEGTIRSVLGQDYGDVEYIVVDGGSTDGTLDVLAEYDGRIAEWISEPDRGIYDAMNKGIQRATGEIVGFLNADDAYADERVLSDVAGAMAVAGCDAVYGDLVYVSPKDGHRVVRYWQTGLYKPKSFYSGWVPPHPTFFCRKSLFDKFGGFDPSYEIAGDFELMLRLIEKHRIGVRYLQRPFVRMRAGGRANTVQGIFQGNREIVRAFGSNGLKFPLRFFCVKPFRKVWQVVRRRSKEVFLSERGADCAGEATQRTDKT